jgi:hypothetical protein
LPRDCFYLVQGDPGSGKTTLALQFLLEGLRRGEKVFYITLSETREELLQVARSHGWSIDKIPVLDCAGNGPPLSSYSKARSTLTDRASARIHISASRSRLRGHPKSSCWCTHLLTNTPALQQTDNVSRDNHSARASMSLNGPKNWSIVCLRSQRAETPEG